ncbi:MAG: type II secretion system protein GspG [Planctomycetota bacterium]
MRTAYRQGGFTLIEMIVVIAIIVSLAGIIIPVVSSELEDAKKGRALGDMNRIATGINQYIKDTGFFPTGDQGAETFHWVFGNGELPQSNDFDDGASANIMRFLSKNDFGGAKWRGPYMAEVGADPWGRAYIVNVQGYYEPLENVLIVCAGPNGQVDTTTNATVAAEDDIMILID